MKHSPVRQMASPSPDFLRRPFRNWRCTQIDVIATNRQRTVKDGSG